MMRVMTVVFLGVVLGVDSRLGYWDLVGGGEIRNMVIVVFIVIIIIITIIILDPIYTIHITMVSGVGKLRSSDSFGSFTRRSLSCNRHRHLRC